jgi:uncharacterized membrane protein
MVVRPRQALWMIAAGATLWFGLTLLAPVLPPALGAIVYGIGALVCHQRPERSFHWDGAQLAVCARCIGIYAGASLALTAAALGFLRGRYLVDMRMLRAVLLAAALPTAITVGAEWAGWWLPSHATRAASGLPLGAGAALVVAAALAPRRGLLHYGECLPPAAAAPRPPQTRM